MKIDKNIIYKVKKIFWRYSSLVPIDLSKELEPYKRNCKGIILNVGSGTRPLDLGPLQLKTDVDPSFPLNFTSDAHNIPFLDNTVDTIVNIAVLEHTRYPWEVVSEFYRVLKPGGLAVIAVPFLQPEHNMPYDYFRFTRNGIVELLNYSGFEIESVNKLFNSSRIISWILIEHVKRFPRLLRNLILPVLHILSRMGKDYKADDCSVYRGTYVVAKKPGDLIIDDYDVSDPDWYFPFLCCPITKKRLIKKENNLLVLEDNSYSYPVVDGVPRLCPEAAISNKNVGKVGREYLSH